jgi:hypothetical protein
MLTRSHVFSLYPWQIAGESGELKEDDEKKKKKWKSRKI